MLSSRPGAIYQQDNARPHTARLSQQCLQGYAVLPWPARSPDLSPIEHVWNALGRQLQPSRDTGELTAIIGRLECGRTQLEVSEELGIAQSVISRLWQRFQDDGNVSRCYSTGRPLVTTPNEDQYLTATAKKKTDGAHHQTPVSSALFSNRYDSFKADRVQTLKAHWFYMLVGLSDVFHLPQLTVACD
ncbi:uncharacterized protein TNCV_3706561 [Trichonephila clavipes]|nr:uncharacterized protein TNCV_3706561 [Trichonephila clavipes]